MHKHNKCCRKYGVKTRRSKEVQVQDTDENDILLDSVQVWLHQKAMAELYCRFELPAELRNKTGPDKYSNILLKRNHSIAVKFNKTILSCLRSNHDILFIPTGDNAWKAAFYMTNYGTKDDMKMHELVMSAAIYKAVIEKQEEESSKGEYDWSKFTMRVYNRLQKKTQLSGSVIANILLGYDNYFSNNLNTKYINLFALKKKICNIMRNSGRMEIQEHNEYKVFLPANIHQDRPSRKFDNYKHRGTAWADFSLYEYTAQVSKRSKVSCKLKRVIPFSLEHPQVSTHIQVEALKSSQYMTPNLFGKLTEFEDCQDRDTGDRPNMTVIENNICETLISLFVSWSQFKDLVASEEFVIVNLKIIFLTVWEILQTSLPVHIKQFADNVKHLRRSKQEAAMDAELAKERAGSIDDMDWDVEEFEPDQEEEIEGFGITEKLNREEFITVFKGVRRDWAKEKLFDYVPDDYRNTLVSQSDLNSEDNSFKLGDDILTEDWRAHHKVIGKNSNEMEYETEFEDIGMDLFENYDANATPPLICKESALRPTICVPHLKNQSIEELRSFMEDDSTIEKLITIIQENYHLN